MVCTCLRSVCDVFPCFWVPIQFDHDPSPFRMSVQWPYSNQFPRLNLSYGHPKGGGGGPADQKMVIFDDFSNFLQGLRYCLWYQNSLNETYLKGSGWDLRPWKWFPHLYSILEISGLWPKYAFTPIFPLPPKISKKGGFLMISPTSFRV